MTVQENIHYGLPMCMVYSQDRTWLAASF